MLKRTTALAFLITILSSFYNFALAQPTWTLDPFGKEKKPEQFENRKLGSEKTAEKKFTRTRQFFQNNITHFNYYFNANNKVNSVVERASISNQDDFTVLLPFYPYSLDNTASQKTELDSVIYTSTAGILLHDLRNDWIDNMYLLIGKAYFYRKDFDSAAMTFQFINYNLFPRKRKDDDDNRVVGTNDAASGSSISIANKEKRNMLQKIVSLPPSRNDALIWLTRTLIEQGEYGEAGGLINTLRNDPNLPKRLLNDLEEVNAYWYFRQSGYDSAAVHLEKALSNANSKEDKSRREFLLAQLYEMGGQFDKASDYYTRASKHTVNPLMDIYARLNEAKMMRSGNPKELDKSIDNLAKMARKDKFEAYRDIIYYSAGQLSLQKPDSNAAIGYFKKSLRYNEANTNFKNKAFLQLADIAFDRRQYRMAASYYDSLQLSDSTLKDQMARIETRKSALSKIVLNIENIEREDSLQKIAALQPGAREDFVKKLLKKLRKESGLKEDNSNSGSSSNPFDTRSAPADLFANNSKGEWYFYNSSLKSRGFNDFKANWGNRINVDNWRRKAAIDMVVNNNQTGKSANNKDNSSKDSSGNAQAGSEAAGLSYEEMMGRLPLTPEKIDASNEIIATNLLALAKQYQEVLEDYEQAVITYEDYLRRFPTRLVDGEVYLGLYYSYTKLGDLTKANYYKNLLSSQFANTRPGQMANNPDAFNPKKTNQAATLLYEGIYNLFLEGDFEKAISEKKKADSIYGVNFWTPQLLYIEALYHVKQRNDSLAISSLQGIIQNHAESPLSAKAATMIDVLKRRSEIESYLSNLQVTRAGEDSIIMIDDKPVVKVAVAPPAVKVAVAPPVVAKDTVKKVVPPPVLVSGSFTMNVGAPHYVIMVLDKVDGVYVNEAKNAFTRYNKEQYYGQPIVINREVLDAERNLLVISPFADAAAALVYYDKIKKTARSEISWLPAAKYSFLIITDFNLELLKANKKIVDYKALLNTQFPNRF